MELYTTVLSTAWGYMAAQFSDKGLWTLTFPRPTKTEALAEAALNLGESLYFLENDLPNELADRLSKYFAGAPIHFDIPIDWRSYTDFQRKVLKAASRLPYGKVSTYGAIAKEIGSPNSARAVGMALHANRTPLVVPCHRVIGANGSLTGFGGGLQLKRALLELENAL